MDDLKFIDTLQQLAADHDITLSPRQSEQFLCYKKLLMEWNAKINLTAITDDLEIITKHFVDSLIPLTISAPPPLFYSAASLIDVGTGAGFPGIPLKIAFPDIQLTLLDSLNKRIVFLQHCVSNLGLDNVKCVHSRAEDAANNKQYRQKFDICTARAVSRLSVLTEYCLPFVRAGGCFAALKGNDPGGEVDEAARAINLLGGELSDIHHYNISATDIRHSIVVIKKIGQTPSIYPRNAAKITKSPII